MKERSLLLQERKGVRTLFEDYEGKGTREAKRILPVFGREETKKTKGDFCFLLF